MDISNSTCPECKQPLKIVRMSCASCGMSMEGDFQVSPLAQTQPAVNSRRSKIGVVTKVVTGSETKATPSQAVGSRHERPRMIVDTQKVSKLSLN